MDAKLWRLDAHALSSISAKNTDSYGLLVQLLLRVTADEQGVLMSYLVSRLS